jgi:alcohol dehydrogenase class IV
MGADVDGVALEDAGKALADRVIEMMRQTGMPNGNRGVGYSEDDLEALTDRAFPQKRLLDNSPRPPDRDQLKELFRDSLSYW